MKSDWLLVLGSRLDVRQTGADAASIANNKKIFHIDCDEGQINNRVKGCVSLVSQLKPAIKNFINNLSVKKPNEDWLKEILELSKQYCDLRELRNCNGINPNHFIHSLSKHSHKAKTFLADVGKHQMWTAQSIELEASQRLLLSGGLGSMGFALPAAIGSAFATGRPVVCILGDGGLQCNIQELEAISHHKLPIKIIVLNNESLGMVGQFQEDYFESRMQSTVWGYSAPDFEAVGKAYKIDSKTLNNPAELDDALRWLWSSPNTPNLLNVMIDQNTKVYPKAAYGRAIDDMDPPIKNGKSSK